MITKLLMLRACLGVIKNNVPFQVESDASDYVMPQYYRNKENQWRTFQERQSRKKHYPAVEKEASAIIEIVRK